MKEKPDSLDDALQLEDITKWEQAMDDEINWMSRLQICVSISSTEVEFVAIVKARKNMILMTDCQKNDARNNNIRFFM